MIKKERVQSWVMGTLIFAIVFSFVGLLVESLFMNILGFWLVVLAAIVSLTHLLLELKERKKVGR